METCGPGVPRDVVWDVMVCEFVCGLNDEEGVPKMAREFEGEATTKGL